jgi:hypothetical protein
MGKVVERWRHAGLDCCIRVGSYSLDGYVRLPDGHPDRQLAETADEVDQAVRGDPIPFATGHQHIPVNIHGGLSDGPDEAGWVGFDTAHGLDYWADEDLAPHLRQDDRICAHMIAVRLQRDGLGTRWTLDRLRAEVNRLAEQLAARGRGTRSTPETT